MLELNLNVVPNSFYFWKQGSIRVRKSKNWSPGSYRKVPEKNAARPRGGGMSWRKWFCYSLMEEFMAIFFLGQGNTVRAHPSQNILHPHQTL